MDNNLLTGPAYSHPPWYLRKSQVHKMFLFCFVLLEFTFFKKPFPVSLDQKEVARVFQFQILYLV